MTTIFIFALGAYFAGLLLSSTVRDFTLTLFRFVVNKILSLLDKRP